MDRFHLARTALPLGALICLSISGCEHTTPADFAKESTRVVVVEVARHEYVHDCEADGTPVANCRDKADTAEKFAQSVQQSLRSEKPSPGAEELSKEFDEFVRRKRVPEGHAEADSDADQML